MRADYWPKNLMLSEKSQIPVFLPVSPGLWWGFLGRVKGAENESAYKNKWSLIFLLWIKKPTVSYSSVTACIIVVVWGDEWKCGIQTIHDYLGLPPSAIFLRTWFSKSFKVSSALVGKIKCHPLFRSYNPGAVFPRVRQLMWLSHEVGTGRTLGGVLKKRAGSVTTAFISQQCHIAVMWE